jgi:hypothetical protein
MVTNYIDDTPIVVNVTFDPRMDHTHLYEDEDEGEFVFNRKMVTQFVSGIMKRSPTKNNKSTTRKSSHSHSGSSISSLSGNSAGGSGSRKRSKR